MKKMIKNITSIVLSMMLILSSAYAIAYAEEVVSEQPTDAVVAEEVKTSAVDVLKVLGIISGESKIMADDIITKGEFISWLVGMNAINDDLVPDVEQVLFFDVPKDHMYAGHIKVAYDRGIITGHADGSLGIDKPITYVDAIVMTVRALDGAMIANANGGYPTGYTTFAVKYDLLEKVKWSTTENITSKDAAQLVFNALRAGVMRTDYTGQYGFDTTTNLLRVNFQVKEREGILDANWLTGIYSGNALNKNRVSINGNVFVSESDYRDYLGYKVAGYYREVDGMNHLLYLDVLDNNVWEVRAGTIVPDTTNNRTYIEYYEDGATSSTKRAFSDTVVTIKNWARVLNGTGDGTTLPAYATFKLIDNNHDGKCDVNIIYEYKLLWVNSVSTDAKKVYLNTTDPVYRLIDFEDYEDYEVVDLDGNVLESKDITKDTIVNVYAKADKSFVKIVICNKTVSATVDSYSIESENGRTYYSFKDTEGNVYRTVVNYDTIATTNSLRIGSRYVFFLDSTGFIAAVSSEQKDTDYKFAWLCAVGKGDGALNDDVRLKIFSSKNTFDTIYANDRVEFNNSGTIKKSVLLTNLAPYNGVGTIIRYRVDEEGKLKSIELPKARTETEGFRIYDSYAAETGEYFKRYNATIKQFGYKLPIDSETITFLIPRANTDNSNADFVAEETNYMALATGDLVNDTSYGDNAESFVVEKDDDFADVVLIRYEDNVVNATENKRMQAVFVTEVADNYDPEEGSVRTITGYESGTIKTYTFCKSKDAAWDNVKEGDVIRVRTRGTEITALYHLFDGATRRPVQAVGGGTSEWDTVNTGTDITAAVGAFYGKLADVVGSGIRIDMIDPKNDTDVVETREGYLYPVVKDTTFLYRFDSSKKGAERFSVITIDDIEKTEDNPLTTDRVLLVTVSRSVKCIVVYDAPDPATRY